MFTWFKEALWKSRTGICLIKDGDRIFFQNSTCKKRCGNFSGKECPQTCLLNCEKKEGGSVSGDGIKLFPNAKVGNQFFDVLFFNALPYRMVLLYPLQKKYESWLKRFNGRKLSRRELEIAGLCLQGLTNSKIMERLFISKATLKTHLNNIYKKMPEARSESWRKF